MFRNSDCFTVRIFAGN